MQNTALPRARPDTGTAMTQMQTAEMMILVDADACPVKAEVYRVAERHGLRTIIVANSYISIPRDDMIERVVVGAGLDVADDWIAERARRGIIVITADVPLAARCVKAGADVIAPNGRPFTPIHRHGAGDTQPHGWAACCRRNHLRPAAFLGRDRSAFLSALDLAIVRLKRGR